MTACLVEHVEQNGSSACRLAGFVEAAGLCELAGVGVALGGALDVLAVVLAGVPWSAAKTQKHVVCKAMLRPKFSCC
jgi:hypothetical protein